MAEADWAKIADRDLSLKNREAGKENEIATRAALALVENIDGNVGRLMAKLDQLGVREETIVIYLSDNGPNTWRWNDGMRGKKGHVDEGGVRVPFFLSWSGTVKPSVIETTAAHIDLLPTLCDLCEVPLPGKNPLDGRSIKPLLMKGGKGWEARTLLSNWRSRVSIRTDRYRATQQGLYDLVADPGQLHPRREPGGASRR